MSDVVDLWKTTTDLHLDSSGIEEKTSEINEIDESEYNDLIGTQSPGLAELIFSEDIGTRKYSWKVKTVRELGDSYAKITGEKTQNNWDRLLGLWNKTHSIKITYDLSKKFNTWNQGPTEWGMNSTSNSGSSNETPYAGWSEFTYSNSSSDEIVKFNTIRSNEIPHKHAEQTEIYKVYEGVAYLMHVSEDNIILIKKGNQLVIEPNTPHFIVAIEPPYKHIVIQQPSGFHWARNKTELNLNTEASFNAAQEKYHLDRQNREE